MQADGSSDGRSATILVIGAGLAGSEAAWQAAQRGAQVVLYEMRPGRMTEVHRTGGFAELVCSNSLGSTLPDRPLGLLKNELRRLGSLVIACADATALPAGNALAVGRDAFSAAVTAAVGEHPRIEVRREELTAIPPDIPTIIASGPLTSPELSSAIQELAGHDHLRFYDAMAPIVVGESVDMRVAFRASRYQLRSDAAFADREATADYINCPLDRDSYYAFVAALNAAEKAPLREIEKEEEARRYFEACLPIEVLAARHPDALAYGPMRPVGLRDPRTARRPFAVVQLRQDDTAGSLYNLVGFQTSLRWGEQERVLRMIPGLERAEFVRFGQMHRNTYIDSPALLRPTLQWHDRNDLFFAGQLTGTEGYVGSTASGLIAGLNAARLVHSLPPVVPPPTSMIGALLHYITQQKQGVFEPMKANFGLLPELGQPIRDKRRRYAVFAERAQSELDHWLRTELQDYPASFSRVERPIK